METEDAQKASCSLGDMSACLGAPHPRTVLRGPAPVSGRALSSAAFFLLPVTRVRVQDGCVSQTPSRAAVPRDLRQGMPL